MAKKRNPPEKTPAKAPKGRTKAATQNPIDPLQADFDVVLEMIAAARTKAITAVNTTLIDLYWNIGQYISQKIAADGWGKGTVKVLGNDFLREVLPHF